MGAKELTKSGPDWRPFEWAVPYGGRKADGAAGFVLVEGEDVVILIVNDSSM